MLSYTNTFTQALSSLMLIPYKYEKQTQTVLQPARVHVYVRVEIPVKTKTEEGQRKGRGGKPKTAPVWVLPCKHAKILFVYDERFQGGCRDAITI